MQTHNLLYEFQRFFYKYAHLFYDVSFYSFSTFVSPIFLVLNEAYLLPFTRAKLQLFKMAFKYN